MYFCPMSIVKAKKSLGQHFLKDQNIARKIIDSLLPVTAEVLEIGPGMGVLTRHLLEQGIFAVKAIDIDQESIAYLHNEFPSYHDRIIFGDFLKTDLSAWYSAPLSVIGNLPYNISSQIFFRIIENHQLVRQVVCMIQKEVAERITATHGNKTYGILSVFLQTFYNIEYLFKMCIRDRFLTFSSISAICRKASTANKLEGIRKPKVVASSEGRKQETIKPTGLTGFPHPSLLKVSNCRSVFR